MISTMAKHERRPISILYMIYGFRVGGAERHLLDLCKGLDRQKFSVKIIYFHRDEQMLPDFCESNIPCAIFEVKRGELECMEIWKLSRVIKKLSPDIVHVHLFHASRFGAMAAYLAGIKRIVRTKHNVYEPGVRPGKKDRIWRVLQRVILTRVVAVSKAIAEQINTPYVIYNGIDTDYFDPEAIDSTKRLDLAKKYGADQGPVIGIAARLTSQKGHCFLLKAFRQILPDWPNAKLLIAGDGPDRSSLEGLALELGISQNVMFLGAIKDIRGFLSILDLFAHPSVFEGLGIAVIEAMSMCLPIVATRVDGLAELISDGVEGILVEPGNPTALANAMNRILKDHELGKTLGLRAREKAVKLFSLQAMIEKYEEFYLDLCR
jgi:glycosyltransferase involved in cell wall biosynthesis